LCLNILLICAQCASIPFLIDNETYYIQTPWGPCAPPLGPWGPCGPCAPERVFSFSK
jgi:hypothetical protein